MKKIEIFDPAMCCSTGVCGPSVDPELLRISTILNVLKKKGVDVTRHNLSQEPQDFATNEIVCALLNAEGNDILPITMLDGEVVKKSSYPTNAEFASWLDLTESDLSSDEPVEEKPASRCCCGPNAGCC